MGWMRRAAAAVVCAVVCAALAPTRAQSSVRVSGAVTDETGAPIGGIRVSLAETGSALTSVVVTTRADGTFDASVAAGVYTIEALLATTKAPPSDLIDPVEYGVVVDRATTVALVARRGTVVQTSVVAEDGTPIPGASVEVFSRENIQRVSPSVDANGWVRLVVGPDESVLVVPPNVEGATIARWLDAEELVASADADGIARPIVLDSLPEPEVVSSDVTRIYRGSAPGGHLVITYVPEGFTDGDEPFEDRNGNGVCDDEPYFDLNGNGKYDPGELYVDANGDGKRTSEPFTDLNGDGVWNHDERALFLRDAVESLRVILGMPVYRELRDRIDFYAAWVPSAQAGSDIVNAGPPIDRDTAFGSVFQSRNLIFNIDRAAIAAAALELVPETNVAGAITYSIYGFGRESGSGVVSLFGTRTVDLGTVVAHEFGHALGGLGDEYYDAGDGSNYGGPDPNAPNLTNEAGLETLKWARFVTPGTPVPTPDAMTDVVGAFEGGYYHRRGAFRPTYNCLMRSTGRFCPVCAEAMFAAYAEVTAWSRPARPALLEPLDGATVDGPFLAAFGVDDLSRVASASAVVDGSVVGTPSTHAPFGVTVDARTLSPGRHDVAVEVTFADGTKATTATSSVDAVARHVSMPTPGTPKFAGGTLTFPGASGIVVPGAVVFVDGGDRYPLELKGSLVRVQKKALGSTSGSKIAKAIAAGRTVRLTIVNADGGRAAEVDYRR